MSEKVGQHHDPFEGVLVAPADSKIAVTVQSDTIGLTVMRPDRTTLTLTLDERDLEKTYHVVQSRMDTALVSGENPWVSQGCVAQRPEIEETDCAVILLANRDTQEVRMIFSHMVCDMNDQPQPEQIAMTGMQCWMVGVMLAEIKDAQRAKWHASFENQLQQTPPRAANDNDEIILERAC